jgi:hypothetical protein
MEELKIGWNMVDLRRTVSAEWNYKGDHKRMMMKLIRSIVDDGFIVSCLLRHTECNELEVVDGNHRREGVITILGWVDEIDTFDRESEEYALAKKYLDSGLDLTKVMCYYLGKVSELRAKELSFKLNENRFPSDREKIKTILDELIEEHGDDIFESIPFEKYDFYEPQIDFEFKQGADYTEYDGISNNADGLKIVKFIVSDEIYQKWIDIQTKIQIFQNITLPSDIFEHILDNYEK